MRSSTQYIRLLHPWQLERKRLTDDRVRVERLVYDRSKKPLRTKVQAGADFEGTELAPFIRQALSAYILLGKISPAHVQMIADEYRQVVGGCAPSQPSFEPPTTFSAFLQLLGPQVYVALDDPMTGILTSSAHQGLFGSGVGLIQAIDRMGRVGNDQAGHLLTAYVHLYLSCRQHILSSALSMARGLRSLTATELAVAGDFFAWWRTQWTRMQSVVLTGGGSVSIALPHGITAEQAGAIAGIMQNLGTEYARLADAIGQPDCQPGEFIRECANELNDGLVNLLLNQRGEQRCPQARNIETKIVRAGVHPTRAAYVKEVTIDGEALNDRFKRFFPARHSTVVLPRTGLTVVVWRTGTCPFPDYGFVEADDQPDQIGYCPG